MSKSTQSIPLGSLIVVMLIFLFLPGELSAQTVGQGRTPPRRAPPGPAKPTVNPGRQTPPKANTGTKKKVTTKDLDEARIRKRKKEERDEALRSSSEAPPPSIPTSLNVEFEHLTDRDVRIVSSSWKLEAKKGERPFNVLSLELANLTDRYVTVKDFIIEGAKARALKRSDNRPLPKFPLALERFSGEWRMPKPLPPRSRTTLTFAFPFAVRNPSSMKVDIHRYVKFKALTPIKANPVRIVRWEAVPTRTSGEKHLGMVIALENKVAHDVKARLKVALADVASAGGNTFFFQDVKLKARESRNVILRRLPDEGIPSDDPRRIGRIPSFEVRSVVLEDVLY